jgi:tRNA(fMet)-specific endonuclease VapC
MIRYLLDTDHITLFEHGHPPLLQHLTNHPPNSIGVSVVTVEEVLRGRLAVLNRRLDGAARIRAYGFLQLAVRFFQQPQIVSFDQTCETQFQHLLLQRIRVGTNDLKIAATALAGGLTVVTRNRSDFGQVPGLLLADWSVP